MRSLSSSLAALALVLAGSLASVANAANLERDHREQRSDLYAAQTSSAQYVAQFTSGRMVADDNTKAKADHG